jgi:hypothetical protein
MKHDHPRAYRHLDAGDVATIWPQATDLATPPLAEFASRQTAAPDVPPAVGIMLALAYAAPIIACLATLGGGSGEALFAIIVSGLYVLVYCGVPWLFLRVEADPARRPTLSAFFHRGIDTATGHLSGRAALVQMLIVPVLLTFCLLAIGTMASFYLAA